MLILLFLTLYWVSALDIHYKAAAHAALAEQTANVRQVVYTQPVKVERELPAKQVFETQPQITPEPEPEDEPEPEFSNRDKKLIARVVYAEARGECFEGQVAVAAVVLNRYRSGKYGKTVRRVVFAKHQFAVSGKYNAECMRAVEEAIEGTDHPEDMFYFQASRNKRWRNFIYLYRIGNHSFYAAKR